MSALRLQFTLAARYLAGRKLRAFLTTLAIIFGVMIIFGLNGYLPTFMESYKQNMLATAGKVDISVTSKTGGSFAPEMIKKVRAVDGVAAATPLLKHTVVLPGKYAVNALTVVGLEPETAAEVRLYPVAKGRFLKTGDRNILCLSEDLARRLHLKVGDKFTLPSVSGMVTFRVVGLLAMQVLPGAEEVYVPLESVQEMLGEGSRINVIEASFEANADRTAVKKEIRSKIGTLYRLGTLATGTELFASIEIGQFALNMFGVFALIAGGFIILNTFRTVVAERRHDIGMLRAVGASRGTILGSFLAESLIQGIFGTAVGLIAGYGLTYGLSALINPIIEQYMHFTVGRPVFTVGIYVLSISLGLGVAVAGGLYPAVAATRITPLEALRPVVGEVHERRLGRAGILGFCIAGAAVFTLLTKNMGVVGLGVVLFLIGLILMAPAMVKPVARVFGVLIARILAREGMIAEGNMARQPGRAAITASAIMISMTIVVAMIGVATSIFTGINGYMDKSMGTDFLIMPQSLVLSGGNVGAGPALLKAIRETPGVGSVASLRLAKGELKGIPVQVIGIEPKSYAKMASFEFSKGGKTSDIYKLDKGRTLFVNGIFAAQNRVEPGDVVTLLTSEGKRHYKVAAVASDYLNAKISTAYISHHNLERDFHAKTDVLIMANLAKGAKVSEVKKKLEKTLSDYPAFSVLDSAGWRQNMRDTFNRSMFFYYFLIALLALPCLLALINTLTINIVARMREIGMLRAVGSTRRQVGRMILGESLLLSAMGTAFGLLAGVWLGYILVEAMNSSGFPLPYFFPWAGILIAIAAGLLFGVLASVLPAYQAAKVDIVSALHYE